MTVGDPTSSESLVSACQISANLSQANLALGSEALAAFSRHLHLVPIILTRHDTVVPAYHVAGTTVPGAN